jgi:hypothetical protein
MNSDHTTLDTDGISTVYFPPPRSPHTKLWVGIVAALVVLAGAVAGIILTAPSRSSPASSTSQASAGTGQGNVSAFSPSPAKTPKKTRPVSCLNGSENGECYGIGDGPPLPHSLRGQPYVCLIMADTSECVVIFVHHPATGQCTEFDYVAPQAPGTEDGWKQGEDAAEYQCP